MAANSTGLSWDPWSTFGGEATSSSERSTHVNLQLAIKTPSMPLEPINAAQQTAAHIPGCDEDSNPCTSVRRLGPSPTFKNDIFPCDNSTSLLSHADWGYTCDTSFGESLMVEASSRDSFIPDQYFDTMRYPNHPRPLSKSNTLTFDGLAFSADTYAVQNTQEDSKSAHSLGNGPSVKGSNVDLNDNGSNTGEDSTVPESAVMGDTLALGGLDSSINMCTVEHRPKNSKEVSASSRSLLADSLDKSPSAKEPKGISDDHDSNAGGDPNTSKSPSPPEREKSASRGIDSSVDGCTGANESRSRSLSAKSPVDGKSRMEPIIIPDGDDSNSLWLDRPSVATQSLKLANKGPIAPEKSLPISDVAAKRSRTPNIPTGKIKSYFPIHRKLLISCRS